MLKSSLCDYSDAYILVRKMIITGARADAAARPADKRHKEVVFKTCATFMGCISKINNIQEDNARHFDLAMPISNLIEYSDNYSKASESLWQCYRGEPALDKNANIVNFRGNSASFKAKAKIKKKLLMTVIQKML